MRIDKLIGKLVRSGDGSKVCMVTGIKLYPPGSSEDFCLCVGTEWITRESFLALRWTFDDGTKI